MPSPGDQVKKTLDVHVNLRKYKIKKLIINGYCSSSMCQTACHNIVMSTNLEETGPTPAETE